MQGRILKSAKNAAVLVVAAAAFATITNGAARPPSPEVVRVEPGTFAYRLSGEFLKAGRPVDAPQVEKRIDQHLLIMKFQVSRADYARCIDAGACGAPFKPLDADPDRPVTGVSFDDASAYAAWLSKETGDRWRLPTDAEWAYSAADRFFDDALGLEDGTDDPTKRLLLRYQQAAGRSQDVDPHVRPRGAFGVNRHGLSDLSGNVWEWTGTCYQRYNRNGDDITPNGAANCGVRVVEGRHRTYMTTFIQDAKSGGCSVGAPPEYLGFRLVREAPPFLSLRGLRTWWHAARSP